MAAGRIRGITIELFGDTVKLTDAMKKVNSAAEKTSRALKDINKALERHGIGRALWNYKRKDFGLVDPHYDGVRDELIDIIR